MSKITGKAKKFDGAPVDYVSIFNWSDGKCIAQVIPDASGNWSYAYNLPINIGITYIADGCEPITHGKYSFVPNPLEDSILHYSFDGNVLDQSDYNLNGVKVGNVDYVAGRKVGTQAINFTNGCVYTTAPLPINSNKVSLSFWLKASVSTGTLETVIAISKDTDTNNSFGAFINNTVTNGIDLFNRQYVGGSGTFGVTATPNAINSEWTHYVMVIDRSLPNLEELKIYKNDVLMPRTTQYTAETSGLFKNDVLYVGKQGNSVYPFLGAIQDLRIYNRVLTAEERTQLFNE